MNNIGFAATKNTAATNNNTATPAASSLGVLANNFSSSSNALSGNFNTLILGLFIQIIQTLLKNLQNKPCCDQPPKPTDKPLDLSDTQLNKLDKLPSLGKTEPGSDPTIKSVIDTDGNNQLSVGDKVNFEQVTDQLDANGQAIIKTSTKTLTANDLSIYNSLKAPNQLSDADTERVQAAINQLGAVGTNGAPQATGCYYDNDADGKLSVGDQVEALIFTDVSGAPPTDGSYRVAKKTVDEAFLALYNPPTTSNSLSLSAEQIANINSNDTFSSFSFDPKTDVITDTNKDGKLSAGDIISGLYMPNFSFDGLSGPTKTWANTLTEGDVNAINGDNGQALLSSKLESNQEILQRIEQVLGIREAGVVSNEHVKAVFDKNADNQLSAGDIVVLTASFSQGAISGEPLPVLPTQYIELTQEQVDQIKPTTVGQGLI